MIRGGSSQGIAGFVAVFAVLLSIPGTRPDTPSGKVIFRFDPPDRLTFIETEQSTRTREIPLGGRRVDVFEARSRITVHRTHEGASFHFEVLSVGFKRDGKDLGGVLQGLRGAALEIDTDRSGRLLRVRGLEQYVKAMTSALLPIVRPLLGTFLDEQRLAAEVTEEWNDRFAELVGLEASVGDVFTHEAQTVAPTGRTPFSSASRIDGREACGTRRCVRITWVTSTDPARVRRLVRVAPGGAPATPPTTGPVLASTDSSVEGVRVLDPATMLLISETVVRTSAVRVSVPFVGEVTLTQEKRKETL